MLFVCVNLYDGPEHAYTIHINAQKASTLSEWPEKYLLLAAPDDSIICCCRPREVDGLYEVMIAQEFALLGRSIHHLDIACLHQRSIRFPARVLKAPYVVPSSHGQRKIHRKVHVHAAYSCAAMPAHVHLAHYCSASSAAVGSRASPNKLSEVLIHRVHLAHHDRVLCKKLVQDVHAGHRRLVASAKHERHLPCGSLALCFPPVVGPLQMTAATCGHTQQLIGTGQACRCTQEIDQHRTL